MSPSLIIILICCTFFTSSMCQTCKASDLIKLQKQLDEILAIVNSSNAAERELLDACEIPENNVITTVIGTRLHHNPKYIPQGYYAAFRCANPASSRLDGGSADIKCLGIGEDRFIDRKCVQLRNESEWQAALIQMSSEKRLCKSGASNNSDLMKDPFSPTTFFQCVNHNGDHRFATNECGFRRYFDENSKACFPGLESTNQIKYKPSIIVNATKSKWDVMGWLLVEKGSKVTLDCIYPRIESTTNVTWTRNDYDNPDPYSSESIPSHWISDYRNRIVFNKMDDKDIGVYTCHGKYYKNGFMPSYSPDTHSHAVTIAIKGKECPDVPLPDFQLHQEYYKRFYFMNHVRRSCQRPADIKKTFA